MFSSPIEESETVLKEVRDTIRNEVERPRSVLCETDRQTWVKEEKRLSKLLKETSSESQSSVWGLLGLASPNAKKCLKDAKALRQRVEESIAEGIRARVSGDSSPPSSNRELGSADMNTWDAEALRAEGSPGLTNRSVEITSPANPQFSLPELSGLNNGTTTAQQVYTRVSNGRNSGSSNGDRRRTRPPAPSPRRMVQSYDSESDDSTHTANARARGESGRYEGGFKTINSDVLGMTINRDSKHCSGAVIHTVMAPSRSSRHISQV